MIGNHDLSSLSILIVETNEHMISIVKALLKSFGIKSVTVAKDTEEASAILRTTKVDVIILDYKLQPLDGIEFTRLVRTTSDSPNPFIPMIMLTAYAERARVELARDAGINEFLCKPISAKDLYNRIVAVIERPRRFIRTKQFAGPDRRRRTNEIYRGKDRRKNTPELEIDIDIDIDDQSNLSSV